MTGFPLYHCDKPEHGYCFHLDDDLTGLTKEEQIEWNVFEKAGYTHYKIVAEIDAAIRRAQEEYDGAEEAAGDAMEQMEELYTYKRLLVKRLGAKTMITVGMGLDTGDILKS